MLIPRPQLSTNTGQPKCDKASTFARISPIALVLAAFSFVSKVVLFDEDTPYELIKLVQPDILVKGGDYKPEDIVGYDLVTKRGGEVVTIELVEGHSTSSIIHRMSI